MDLWKYGLAGFLQPFFWLVVLGLALWITRRLFPRAERWLFDPLSVTVRRAIRLWRQRSREDA
jgi:hypothetical protein